MKHHPFTAKEAWCFRCTRKTSDGWRGGMYCGGVCSYCGDTFMPAISYAVWKATSADLPSYVASVMDRYPDLGAETLREVCALASGRWVTSVGRVETRWNPSVSLIEELMEHVRAGDRA